jgi:hypothetical protein
MDIQSYKESINKLKEENQKGERRLKKLYNNM